MIPDRADLFLCILTANDAKLALTTRPTDTDQPDLYDRSRGNRPCGLPPLRVSGEKRPRHAPAQSCLFRSHRSTSTNPFEWNFGGPVAQSAPQTQRERGNGPSGPLRKCHFTLVLRSTVRRILTVGPPSGELRAIENVPREPFRAGCLQFRSPGQSTNANSLVMSSAWARSTQRSAPFDTSASASFFSSAAGSRPYTVR